MGMSGRVEYLVLSGFLMAVGMGSGPSFAITEGGVQAPAESLIPPPQPSGLLQVWATAWDQDEDPSTDPAGYGDPEDDLGFKIRRARVGLEGEADQFRYSLLVGVASPFDQVGGGDEAVNLVDAYGSTRVVDDLWISLGLQKVPVSREMLMSAGDLALGERSVATIWLAPGRDMGLVIDGSLGTSTKLRARGGVFNGNNDPFGDDDPGMLLALRVDASTGGADLDSSHGTAEGLSLGLGLDGWVDQSFSTKTLGAGGDLAVRLGGLTALLEGRFVRIEPIQGGDVEPPESWSETTRVGGLAQVGYSLGSWEPAVRFSTFDDSTSAEDNGDVAGLLAGVTWHGAGDAIRVGAGYVKRIERSGATTANDTARIWLQTRL
jgi:hypothetical protein